MILAAYIIFSDSHRVDCGLQSNEDARFAETELYIAVDTIMIYKYFSTFAKPSAANVVISRWKPDTLCCLSLGGNAVTQHHFDDVSAARLR